MTKRTVTNSCFSINSFISKYHISRKLLSMLQNLQLYQQQEKINKELMVQFNCFCDSSSNDYMEIDHQKFNAHDFQVTPMKGWKRKPTDIDNFDFGVWINPKFLKVVIYKKGMLELLSSPIQK
jgi:hypothetical protein